MEDMAKRDEDAGKWKAFLAEKLLPRLQRDQQRHGGQGDYQVRVRA